MLILLFGSVAWSKDTVDFGREIHPIFQRACFECHGVRKQSGEFRLDQRQAALSDKRIISPGRSLQSELVRRISLPQNHDEVMPNRGSRLTDAEIAKIKTWIDEGAVWPNNLKAETHWSYVPPRRSRPPREVEANNRVINPIDAWIVNRLRQEGISFSEPAEKATLIRRVSLDLTGLPPEPSEVEAFLRDESPQSYDRLVDRLLASPQYGVRWARPWLDYARYADSHGFQRDDFRDLWPYRDWVVNALNDDMPFDQFTTEQLAGDLLPDATESQRVATGFNRSAPTNVEAGSDPEETRVNQVLDRVNTLGMIWLGTTLECAQCHDHKYDPFTQRDYYGLFAFFNNTSLEADRTNQKVPGSIQFRGPSMNLRDAAIEAEQAQIRKKLSEVNDSLRMLDQQAEAGLAEWETAMQEKIKDVAEEYPLEITAFESSGGSSHEVLPDGSVLIGGDTTPDKETYTLSALTNGVMFRGIKLEALTDDSLPGKGPGRGDAQRPNFVVNSVTVTVAPKNEPTRSTAIKFLQAKASFSQSNMPATNLLKGNNSAKVGWAISPRFHESHWATLTADAPFGFMEGTIFTIKIDQNFGGGRTIGRLRISAMTGDATSTSLSAELTKALSIPRETRTEGQRKVILEYRLKEFPERAPLIQERDRMEARLKSLNPPSTLVMREDTPRLSSLFQRGDFRNPGEAVTASTPSVLHPFEMPQSGKSSRLDLARWLVRRDNPLVARVVVNRWWAELFGHGLVATPEDFGIKGENPTHPELLDWLACEFMDGGWSQKKLLKTIVTSATYRQSSRVTSELIRKDDRNRLYARGPRHRLEAELIRDNALAIAGLLNSQLGGPPIKPYQPDGLWVKVGGQRYDYEVSPGAEKHRRGLYVVWKRAAPFPSFVSFDANNRMTCRVQRPRSNTPLQALALMNDPVYVEAAKSFATRILTERSESDDGSRIEYALQLALSRKPLSEEISILRELLAEERSSYQKNPDAAKTFVGSFSIPSAISANEFAAWYAVAAAILNLDETITKG